ncbi:MAG: hypothetical protein M3431_00170 [Actinomycetota bacterium]|nr:hypothetical protein [Actinomycetota bacterium]
MTTATPNPSGTTRSRRFRIATTFALSLLVVSGGLWAPHSMAADGRATAGRTDGAGGMGSPEAAVEELLASVGASDPIGLLAVLHPDERYLVDTLYTNATTSAETAGAVDVQALLRSLYVEVDPGELVVEQLSERLAWVTADRADVTARLDVAQLDEAVAADLSDIAPVDEFRRLYAPQGNNLGIAVVNEGGQWFVSVLYTTAEIGRRELELPAQFGTGPVAPAKTTTPEEAVTAFAAAVASKDPRAIAALLTPFEAGLVADYESTLGAELLDGLEGYDLAVDPSHLNVADQGDGWAIVEVDRWSVGATVPNIGDGDADDTDVTTEDDYGYEDDDDVVRWQLTVDGLCGEFRAWADTSYGNYSDVSGSCAFTADSVFNVASFLVDEGWRGPRFVVVQRDGSWAVSLLQTALNIVAPFTTDIVTAAGVGEMVYYFSADFYRIAAQLVASGLPTLPIGTSAVPTSGHGRVAVFRLEPGAEASIDIQPGGHRVCYLFIVDLDNQYDETNAVPCDEPVPSLPGEAVVVVTASGSTVFSGLEPLGDVTVTVS